MSLKLRDSGTDHRGLAIVSAVVCMKVCLQEYLTVPIAELWLYIAFLSRWLCSANWRVWSSCKIWWLLTFCTWWVLGSRSVVVPRYRHTRLILLNHCFFSILSFNLLLCNRGRRYGMYSIIWKCSSTNWRCHPAGRSWFCRWCGAVVEYDQASLPFSQNRVPVAFQRLANSKGNMSCKRDLVRLCAVKC